MSGQAVENALKNDGGILKSFKIPESVLVVIYTPRWEVLMIERADNPGFWQSVTGSRDTAHEPFMQTAVREVREETSLVSTSGHWRDWLLSNVYEIYPAWRHRYAPGVTHNTEYIFSLCVPSVCEVVLNPHEHIAWRWLPHQAAADLCFSPSNAEAILLLPHIEKSKPIK